MYFNCDLQIENENGQFEIWNLENKIGNLGGKGWKFIKKKMEIWGKHETWKNCKFGKMLKSEKIWNFRKIWNLEMYMEVYRNFGNVEKFWKFWKY